MSEKIPTLKDFFLDKFFPSGNISEEDKELWFKTNEVIEKYLEISKEHTKLHVQAALEAATNITVNYSNDHAGIDKNSILNAYPEDLIQ